MLGIHNNIYGLAGTASASLTKPLTNPPPVKNEVAKATVSSISAQGQAMLAQEDAHHASSSATSSEWPVEMYQIPPWLASVLPMSGGELPKLLNGFGDGHVTLNKDFLSDGKDAQRVAYTNMFNQHWRNLLDEHGIHTPEVFHQKMIADVQFSEKIHQQLKELIQGDRQMIALASQFDWNPS